MFLPRHVLAMVAAVLHDVLDDANVDPATIEVIHLKGAVIPPVLMN
jgi:hypothetical protein